jgi:hypothetical protein
VKASGTVGELIERLVNRIETEGHEDDKDRRFFTEGNEDNEGKSPGAAFLSLMSSGLRLLR